MTAWEINGMSYLGVIPILNSIGRVMFAGLVEAAKAGRIVPVALLLCVLSSAAQNLALNPGFESGRRENL